MSDINTLTDDYDDERLEYMLHLGVEILPEYEYDEETHDYEVCGTRALNMFVTRYNGKHINNNFTYEKYIDNKEIQDTLKALNIDIDKFWVLLMFIFDYSYSICYHGIKIQESGLSQLNRFCEGFIENCKKIDTERGLFEYHNPVSISLKIKGKKEIIIEHDQALAFVLNALLACKEDVEQFTRLNCSRINFGEEIIESQSIQIWIFANLFQKFFNLPKFKDSFTSGRQKKGSFVSMSKTLLVSRLIYFSRVSSNKNFLDDDSTLKGYIKQYKNKAINTISGVYEL